YRFQDVLAVADRSIEVFRDDHPLLRRLYVDNCGKRPEVEVAQITGGRIDKLKTAFELLKRWHQRYYDNVLKATKRIVIFNSDRMNSFASMSAHGIAFLNASVCDDEIFFLEDIAHQCGHIVFNALTFETEAYLAVDPDTPLWTYNNRPLETRTVYEAVHGVF